MAKLVVLVTTEVDKALEIAEAWQDEGNAPGVTIIDSHGIRALKRESKKPEVPLFVSMASVLHQIRETNQMIFSVVEDEYVDQLVELTRRTIGDLLKPDSGIIFVVDVERVIGLKYYNGDS